MKINDFIAFVLEADLDDDGDRQGEKGSREEGLSDTERYKRLGGLLLWAEKQYTKDPKDPKNLLERARESLKTGSYKQYKTEFKWKEDGKGFDFFCSCPDHKFRNRVCKHVIARALMQNLDLLLERSPRWRNFFSKEYKVR